MVPSVKEYDEEKPGAAITCHGSTNEMVHPRQRSSMKRSTENHPARAFIQSKAEDDTIGYGGSIADKHQSLCG